MDNHSSHFSPVFVNKAAEEQIIVFCLPHSQDPTSGQGHVWAVKKDLESAILNNPGRVITTFQFSTLFGRAFNEGYDTTQHNEWTQNNWSIFI